MAKKRVNILPERIKQLSSIFSIITQKSTLDATFSKLHLKCWVNMEVPARFELANESFAGILTTVENPCDTNHFLIRLPQNDNHLLIILRSVIVGLTAVFPYPFFKFLLWNQELLVKTDSRKSTGTHQLIGFCSANAKYSLDIIYSIHHRRGVVKWTIFARRTA